MSHFTTIKVQIKDGQVLAESLRELGHEVLHNVEVRGFMGDKTTAEYVIRQANGYDLGFRRSGDTYELVADFWGARIDETAFVNAVNQKYAHRMLMQSVVEQGFDVEEEETLEDGTVRVVVGRWV